MTKLDSLRPEKAVEMYLTSREDEVTKKSLQNINSDLKIFKKWCDAREVTDMNDVDGRALADFRTWRAEQVKLITLKHNLWTIKKYIRFCEQVDAVQEGTSEKVVIPETSDADEVNDSFIQAGEAEDILEYLEKYEYASLRHAVFYTLWHTGIRSSSLLALDLKDFHPEENKLCIRHRPTTGTALKNKDRGERNVSTTPAYDHRGRKPSSGAGSRDDLSNESLGSLMIGLSLFLPSVEGRNYPIWIGKSGFDKSKSS
ncbi:hypothetical protein G9463_18850 [Haloarcula sp. JP-Z28]|uniref:tyrosine-type recombinase/integrase n=1 Tax=Haloarcula sp. JP-Z28 TaxID=2716715 RepID=UPI0014047CD0|nr:hypothetical protein [Haloarcula sp. JP-Z28]NHN65344.1 hypothetical protein [Haloarcula sp. JP-Z28]